MSRQGQSVSAGFSYIRNGKNIPMPMGEWYAGQAMLGRQNRRSYKKLTSSHDESFQMVSDAPRVGLSLSADGVPPLRMPSAQDSGVYWQKSVDWMKKSIQSARQRQLGGQVGELPEDEQAAKTILMASFYTQSNNKQTAYWQQMQTMPLQMLRQTLSDAESDVARDVLDTNGGLAKNSPMNCTDKNYQFKFDPTTGKLVNCTVDINSSGFLHYSGNEGNETVLTEQIATRESARLCVSTAAGDFQEAEVWCEGMQIEFTGDSVIHDVMEGGVKIVLASEDGASVMSHVDAHVREKKSALLQSFHRPRTTNSSHQEPPSQEIIIQKAIVLTQSVAGTEDAAMAQSDLKVACQGYMANQRFGCFSDSCAMAARLMQYAETASPQQQKVVSQAVEKLFVHSPGEDLNDAKLIQNQRACLKHLNNKSSQRALGSPIKKSAAFIAVAVITALTGGLAAFGFAILAAQESKKAESLMTELKGRSSRTQQEAWGAHTGAFASAAPNPQWVTKTSTASTAGVFSGPGKGSDPGQGKTQTQRPKPPKPPKEASPGQSSPGSH